MARKIKVQEKKLGREKALGQFWNGDNLIEIDPRQNAKEKLSTLIHEGLHAADMSLSEKKVLKIEKVLVEILWREKYRKIID